MEADLAAFLADRSPAAVESVIWGDQIRLDATAYVSNEIPPLPYISSVRAIVFRDGSVLVQQDRDSRHIPPGGRRERDESPETTVRREVAEETGWSLGPLTLLGFTHLHHLTPIPAGYAYPYPDFCWLVYVGEAVDFSLEMKLEDGYEVGTELLPVESVRNLPLSPCQQAYLEAAVAFRAGVT